MALESLTDLGFPASPEVLDLCMRQDLAPHVATAVRIARSTFSPIHHLDAEVEVDPDTDDQRVILDVTVDVSPEVLLEQYREYTRRWVRTAPRGALDWVRMSYHILRD